MRSVEECYRGSSVRVFRLDREGVLARLRAAAANILASRPDVLEVRLFGSLARGDASPGSDADLLVTVQASAEPFLDRGASLAPLLGEVGIGCDIVVYTTAELARLRREGSRFYGTVEAEGQVLAHR